MSNERPVLDAEHEHVHGPDCQHDHHEHQALVATYKRDQPKVGRNDPCFCGSGKKYKKCHGEAAQ